MSHYLYVPSWYWEDTSDCPQDFGDEKWTSTKVNG